jgi:glycosyltransferase involved in cell wall biosynthesis
MMISVITVNLNNCAGLDSTIASVVSQTYSHFEYIIIDGGSTDGSLEVINNNAQDITTWVSECDTGIYNAMNKGIKMANGEYLLFLNSGDTFINQHILNDISPLLDDTDLIYGDIQYIDESKKWVQTFNDKLDFEYFMHYYLPHPATFIRKELFEIVGFYNESNKLVSDWEFTLLAVNKFNCSYKHIPFTISIFKVDGISSKNESAEVIKKEREDALKNNFPHILPGFLEMQSLRKELAIIHNKYYILQNSKLNKLNQKLKQIFKK